MGRVRIPGNVEGEEGLGFFRRGSQSGPKNDDSLMRMARISREFPAVIKFLMFHKVLEGWNNTKPSKIKGLQEYFLI
jgi:hypothetical protein